MREAAFFIGGIDCAACVERLNRLVETSGIETFIVNPVNSHAQFSYDEIKISVREIERKIRRLGYSVSNVSIRIGLEKSLNAAVVRELETIEGIKSVDVQSQPPRVTITYWDINLQSEDFLYLFRDKGVQAELLDVSGGDEEQVLTDRVNMLRRMVLAAVLTMPLMWNPMPIIQFILATLIQFIPNLYFYRGAWKSVRSKSLNMDSLITISTTAIYLYSSVNAFTQTEGVQLYFLGQGVLSSIIFFGKYMEILVKGQSSQAIKELLRLQPQTATVFRNGEKVVVEVSEIQEGDRIWLCEGERIPTDGTVETGICVVNESMLTGESTPITKRPGDEVYGGTYNCDGSAVYHAHNLGAESRLRQIIDIVEKAQLSKAPIQSMADKAASWFIPAVLVIGVGTFLAWFFYLTNYDLAQALMNMCGVLVIACPCALGLATPTAIMVGSVRAAEEGILFRGSEQIEKAKNITDIVFDKTGTLTMGNMTVEKIISLGGKSTDELLRLAAALEWHSKHPIAQAIMESVQVRQLSFENIMCANIQIYSNGICGVVNGEKIACGNRKFLLDFGIESTEKNTLGGCTAVWLSVNGRAEGIFCLSDKIRRDAKAAVERLCARGMTVWMVTGDRETVTQMTAETLGIDLDHVRAGVTPTEKSIFIDQIQAQGKRVAMVGDGVNDAPALAASDLAIAIGSGTAIAAETSDVILLGSELSAVCSVFSIAGQILRVVRENFLWAILYNVISIPLACAGIVNPSIASAFMSFSSIFVLLHSLKLKRHSLK